MKIENSNYAFLVFTIKYIDFSKTVVQIYTKKLEINVIYRVSMKPSHSSIDSLLIFQNYIVIFKAFNEDFESISKKVLIFSKLVDYIITKMLEIFVI